MITGVSGDEQTSSTGVGGGVLGEHFIGVF